MSPHLVLKLKITRENSCHHQHRMAAIILRKGRVLSAAANSLKTHPKAPHKHHSSHAEYNCVKKVKNRKLLKGSTMIVYRETATGMPALAKPCPSCFDYIKSLGFKSIIYSTDVGFVSESL